MSKEHAALIKELGLTCPRGGDFYVCDKAKVQFIGCCAIDPCDNDGICPEDQLVLSSFTKAKYDNLPPQSCDNSTITDEDEEPLLTKRAVSNHRLSLSPTYTPFLSPNPSDPGGKRLSHAVTAPMVDAFNDWHPAPGRLHSQNVAFWVGWIWDILLTLVPLCFIALSIVAVYLDGQQPSDYGERVVELTRLSPSIYPILFAAIASRFYKNVSRWCLERPDGIGLAALEQIFGSRSFAAAIEGVFFIRTQLSVGLIILFTWAMSPLGGQSASRLLSVGNSAVATNVSVYFSDPSYQVSYYPSSLTQEDNSASITALYSATLLSSQEQKRSSRDLWNLPKIPQWSKSKKQGEWYEVNEDALSADANSYISLLGIKVQGLSGVSGETRFNFTAQTSYADFECAHTRNIKVDTLAHAEYPTQHFGTTVWVEGGKNSSSSTDPSALSLSYISYGLSNEDSGNPIWAIINCTMQTVTVETELRCGPSPSATSCSAFRQRRVNGHTSSNRPPSILFRNNNAVDSANAVQQVLKFWPTSSGEVLIGAASPTENYIMGELHPFAGQKPRRWAGNDLDVFPDEFSRRFTTAFNTFWDATLNPLTHTNVSFGELPETNVLSFDEPSAQPFMNSTIGERIVSHRLLAILGLALQFFIRGPDILGFASTMTRDNPYVPVAPGGSNLDGPDRARMLRDLRLQLADVRPDDANGYIAVRAVPSVVSQEDVRGITKQERKAAIRPLDQRKLYT
ncbi:uncharacterized protein NECHADRAFT_50718 [Fusarium vanettenii 77-13-4]|uniref:Uncharacterized protein n=1 Tax=Fusarium vanettenii (strain ATCC MYA-4622 / CBS 123669 / FGSC 9596 / NRRL 45880 / 77-13-4) TaxID=660122 RepID=C7Z1D9_FUSV7|nr:uncharacterized protein NECHADRAFT_50718 [Fusarium vanettenii 77-13-4]EEU41987.1 hypothetical protein NECHADRAFT_50718 [Fusarium vanettenii 77-13-4]